MSQWHISLPLHTVFGASFYLLNYHDFPSIPEQFTPVWIFFVIDGELQDTAEVERQPAQSKD